MRVLPHWDQATQTWVASWHPLNDGELLFATDRLQPQDRLVLHPDVTYLALGVLPASPAPSPTRAPDPA